MVTVKRFWRPQGRDCSLDSDGFLSDPEATVLGQSLNPDVLPTHVLSGSRCLVLLGEPGAGKSTMLPEVVRLVPAGTSVVCIDLSAYGSEDRLVREVAENSSIVEWRGGSDDLCLVLDSLDEAQARIPHVGAVLAGLLRQFPCKRLTLRIACRTADWPTSLENTLKDVFDSVDVLEILPLRRRDASAIAAECSDSSRFLAEVARAGAGPLAARPLTLRLLARSFAESGKLPGSGAAVYASGIHSLCEEQNAARRDAGLHGALSTSERVAVARRIAAATVLGGASVVWTGTEVDAGSEDLSIERVCGSTEPSSTGTVHVTPRGLSEVLRTSLFTSRGEHRLGWAHSTFADFLAADWVVKNQLSEAQARPLFLAPDGKCWPQTRLAAAWAVALDPAHFHFLVAADPEACHGRVEIADEVRPALIDGLFMHAATLTTPRWERDYGALHHPEAAEQIRPHLFDADPDRRRLALELAGDIAAVELREDLVSMALDDTAKLQDRVAAGWALEGLTEPYRTDQLRTVALRTGNEGDPQDELKGVALLASWPQSVTAADVFPILTPRQQRSLHGSYSMFLNQFRDAITSEDVQSGLAWLLNDMDAPADDCMLGAVANRVLSIAAATRPSDAQVIHAFTALVRARLGPHEQLLYEDFGGDPRDDPLANSELRRCVAASVLPDVKSHPAQLFALTGYHLDVVRADDLRWLAELYSTVNDDTKEAVGCLFAWTFDVGNGEHRALTLDLPENHPLRIPLPGEQQRDREPNGANSTNDAKPTTCGNVNATAKDVRGDDDVAQQINDRLDQFDEGDPTGFWYSTRLLTLKPGTRRFGPEHDPDVVAMPRWATLSEELRQRLVEAADRYLRSAQCDAEQWIGRPCIAFHPARAGYRAMILLLRVAPERLDALSTSVWVEWAPIIATWSTAAINGASWNDKSQLLKIAGPQGRRAARDALSTHVKASLTHGEPPWATNEATYLWDEALAADYLRMASTLDADHANELITTLAQHELARLRPLMLTWLDDSRDEARQRLAARTLLAWDLERSWSALRDVFTGNVEMAEEVLGRSGGIRPERLEELPPGVTADIYIWLHQHFPPHFDPQFDDIHVVGPREEVGRLRDRLLSQLRDAGSPESVDAIRTIMVALPELGWLTKTLAIAQAAVRRGQWAPTPLPQLLKLASEHSSTVVNSGSDLALAVTSALVTIQAKLTGATPESHLLWDTHSNRPKTEDEISDYLASQLSRELQERGVIVNREVQVRRNRPAGLGERVDILVEAYAPAHQGGVLALPVEVKGAWNSDLLTAMDTHACQAVHERPRHARRDLPSGLARPEVLE